MVRGAADIAFADRDTMTRWKHDIDQRDLLEFSEDLAWFVAEAGPVAPQAEGFPKHIGEKANEDVGLHTMLVVMPDGLITRSSLCRRNDRSASVSWI